MLQVLENAIDYINYALPYLLAGLIAFVAIKRIYRILRSRSKSTPKYPKTVSGFLDPLTGLPNDVVNKPPVAEVSEDHEIAENHVANYTVTMENDD
ncbi:MAG: hypothetical protein LBQ21_06600 [Clostridiales Family XIII bacterium]|jgi:hypothetical protein|nr:hypothetical protein [Clostridiales Family XIII bacterium]